MIEPFCGIHRNNKENTIFSLQQLTIIKNALELMDKSNTRAKNNSKNPEFTVIYDKIGIDLQEVNRIVTTELIKLTNETKAKK